MTDRNRARAEGVIVIVVTLVLVRVFWLLSSKTGRLFEPIVIESAAKILLWGCGSLPVVYWLARRHEKAVFAVVGLGPGAGRSLEFALLSTLPMAAALFILPRKSFNLEAVLGGAVLGPFAEELLFRGFLFGLLWRAARWPVWPAVVVSSALFGLAHLPDGDLRLWVILKGPPAGLACRFWTDGQGLLHAESCLEMWLGLVNYYGRGLLLTAVPLAIGGGALAWISYRWDSLWPAIFLHASMNLWWDLTRGEHALPSLSLSPMAVAQMLSVALAAGLTMIGTSRVRHELTLANDP